MSWAIRRKHGKVINLKLSNNKFSVISSALIHTWKKKEWSENYFDLPSHWVCSLGFCRFIRLLRSPWARSITWFGSLPRWSQFLASLWDRVYHLEDWVPEVKLPTVFYRERAGLLGVDEYGTKVDVADRWDCILAVDRADADFDGNTCDHFTTFAEMRFDDLKYDVMYD